jgi:hypothetical protein
VLAERSGEIMPTEATRQLMRETDEHYAKATAADAAFKSRQAKFAEEHEAAFDARALCVHLEVVIDNAIEEKRWKDFPADDRRVVGQLHEIIKKLETYENAK